MEYKKVRCHSSIVIENAGSFLGVLFAIAISQVDDVIRNLGKLHEAESRIYFIGLSVFFVALIIVLLYHLNRWYKTTISIEDGMLIMEQNTLNKKVSTYTIKNISNIDMEQNLFERIIGTYKMKIDTNSVALANKTDIKIVFSKKDALEFKKIIMSYMNSSQQENVQEEEQFSVSYSQKEVILNCIYTLNVFSIFFMIGLFILTAAFLFMGYSNQVEVGIREIFGSVFAILLALVSTIYSNVKSIIRFYQFRIRREDDKIYIKAGMLRKNTSTIPVNKINGVVIKQPLLSRLFGRYQVEIINIGTGDEKNESSYLLLSGTKEETKHNMEVLLPEFSDLIDMPVKRQSKKYYLHAGFYLFIEAVLLTVVIRIISSVWTAFPLFIGRFAFAAIFLFSLISFIAAYYSEGFYVGKDYLIIEKGIFTKTSAVVRYEKIQSIVIREGVMSKITRLKKSTIFILASFLQSTMILPLAKEEQLEMIAKRVIEAE